MVASTLHFAPGFGEALHTQTFHRVRAAAVRWRLIYQTGNYRGQPPPSPAECPVSAAGPGSDPGRRTPLGFRHRGQALSKVRGVSVAGPASPSGPGEASSPDFRPVRWGAWSCRRPRGVRPVEPPPWGELSALGVRSPSVGTAAVTWGPGHDLGGHVEAGTLVPSTGWYCGPREVTALVALLVQRCQKPDGFMPPVQSLQLNRNRWLRKETCPWPQDADQRATRTRRLRSCDCCPSWHLWLLRGRAERPAGTCLPSEHVPATGPVPLSRTHHTAPLSLWV